MTSNSNSNKKRRNGSSRRKKVIRIGQITELFIQPFKEDE